MGKGKGTLVPLIKPRGASPPVYLAGRAPPARCPQSALWTKPCTRQDKHLRHQDLERFSELPADVTLTDRICTHAGDRTKHCPHAMPSTRQQPCSSSTAPSNAPTRRWNYRASCMCHSFPTKHTCRRVCTGGPGSKQGRNDPMHLAIPLLSHRVTRESMTLCSRSHWRATTAF